MEAVKRGNGEFVENRLTRGHGDTETRRMIKIFPPLSPSPHPPLVQPERSMVC